MDVNIANTEDWVRAARVQNITIAFPASTAVLTGQPFVRNNLFNLPWSEEIIDLPRMRFDSREKVPNALTLETFEKMDRGEDLVDLESIDEFFASLDEDE